MRGVVVVDPGPESRLETATLPRPVPGPGEVLVEVVAAGVNRADLVQREGGYPPPEGASPLLGLEVSGRIAALGPGVEGWHVDDVVCALLEGGGYAEFVTVRATQLLPVPSTVSPEDAAALPEVACTVWSNVFMYAGLQRGEVLLVHGGSSGIGTMAIQLASARGSTVAVTAGDPAKLRRCGELGAEILIDHTREDFAEVIAARAGGADVILDIIGAPYLSRNLDCLAVGGRIAMIGLMGGTTAELDMGRLLFQRAALLGSTLRARPTQEKAEIVRSVIENVWPLVESGAVAPVVHARYPLDRASEAHRVMADSTHVGKILLDVTRLD